MKVRRIAVLVTIGFAAPLIACGTRSTAAPAANAANAASAAAQPASADPWPRQLQLSNAAVSIYQPQVESWQGNQLQFRCAVAATPSGAQDKIFGVIWGTAQTHVDRVNRRVALDNLTLTRSNFPTLPDNGAAYMSALQQQVPGVARTISLDRLEASLAASGSFTAAGVQVINDAPQIIVSYSPAILVPIEGKSVMRTVAGTRFERVINTRALIARSKSSGPFYLHVYDGWMSAGTVDGPWSVATNPPGGLNELAQKLSANGQVDLLDGSAQPKPSLANGVPTIYVSHQPAEIIVFAGQPNLQPIAGTGLLWAANTTSDVIVDTSNNAYYVLLSGRWYTAGALNGPWSFVAGNALPAAFATIPASSPAGVVLAAVAGTPQAQEAVIENSIPQTATVPLQNGPTFSAVYDGAPQWRPISGTSLKYAVNSPTPIIWVDANTFFALRAGLWFTGPSPQGPWVVAASVPAVIYSIPPSSPMYYVTYVRVYGATSTVIYEGYTPGYLGTVVTPDGTVVYGTGYVYEPWIGDDLVRRTGDLWSRGAAGLQPGRRLGLRHGARAHHCGDGRFVERDLLLRHRLPRVPVLRVGECQRVRPVGEHGHPRYRYVVRHFVRHVRREGERVVHQHPHRNHRQLLGEPQLESLYRRRTARVLAHRQHHRRRHRHRRPQPAIRRPNGTEHIYVERIGADQGRQLRHPHHELFVGPAGRFSQSQYDGRQRQHRPDQHLQLRFTTATTATPAPTATCTTTTAAAGRRRRRAERRAPLPRTRRGPTANRRRAARPTTGSAAFKTAAERSKVGAAATEASPAGSAAVASAIASAAAVSAAAADSVADASRSSTRSQHRRRESTPRTPRPPRNRLRFWRPFGELGVLGVLILSDAPPHGRSIGVAAVVAAHVRRRLLGGFVIGNAAMR